MQPLAQKGYSSQQVMDVLHAKSKARNIRFRYDLLDKNLNYKQTLDNVLDGEVAFSAFSAINRTAKFTLREQYTPAHTERQPRTVNFYSGPQSNVANLKFESWSKTNVSIDNGEMRLLPLSGVIVNSTMEDGWRTVTDVPEQAHGWMAGGFKPWQGGTFYRTDKGGGWLGEWSQSLIRDTAGSFPMGMQTISSGLITASGGQKIYASFFYRVFFGEVAPNYIYALGAGGNIRLNENVTITDTGLDGWKRWEGEGTVPAGRPSNVYGLLLGNESNALNGVCDYDNVYFSATAKAIYSGVATSPVLNMSNDVQKGIDIPRVKSTQLQYENVIGQATTKSWFPENIVKTRYSLDGGTIWSSWVTTVPYGDLGIPAGSDARQLRVQLQWNVGRHNSNDNVRLKYVNVAVTYEEDTFVPKKDVINYLQDRIKPYMEIEMPDGVWLEFPLGVFLLNSPTRADQVKGVYRDIEAYDQLVILQEDKATWNRTFWGYPNEEVTRLLVSLGFNRKYINIPPTTKSGVWNFPIGTPVIEIINKMLDTAGYTPLWVDSNGVFRSSPYVLPTNRPSEYTYEDNELSVTYNGMNEELDLFNTANYIIVIQSNVEKTPLWKARANNDPLSPLSTVSTGRRIVDYREVDNLNTQTEVDAYAERILQETSMAYQKIKFNTALMPFHEYQDCLRVRYSELEVDDRYIETSWKMQLKVGGEMEHEARKVVYVSEW